MVARTAGGREVAGSNPVTPIKKGCRSAATFFDIGNCSAIMCGAAKVCFLYSLLQRESVRSTCLFFRIMLQMRPAAGGEPCLRELSFYNLLYSASFEITSLWSFFINTRVKSKEAISAIGKESHTKSTVATCASR